MNKIIIAEVIHNRKDVMNTAQKVPLTGWMKSTLSRFMPNAPVMYPEKAIVEAKTDITVVA